MMKMLAVAAGLSIALGAVQAQAQEKYPSKTVRFIVGFTAGSATDVLARTIALKLNEHWGSPVIVENRPGAGGVLAADLVNRSDPDGHTIMIVGNSHTANPALFAKLPYDTLKDFAGITFLATIPNVLCVSPSVGSKSVQELIAQAKANPGKLNYGSSGIGSGTHMAAEVFNLAAGIQVVHVPFKGTADAITNTISGSVQYSFNSVSSALPLLKSGRVIGLAVSTKQRSAVLPDMPSISEVAGLPDFDFGAWFGMVGPAKLPAAVKNELSRESGRILNLPDVRERLLALGAAPAPNTPEEFDRFIAQDVARMAKVIKAAGIPQQ